MSRVQRFASILLFMLPVFGLSACVTPIVTASGAGCSGLIPSSWREGVAPASLPAGDSVGDWVSFGEAQTGKLELANGRTKDAIDLFGRCEARDAEAVKKARPRFLGIFQ